MRTPSAGGRPRTVRRRALATALVGLAVLLLPAVASAHPLGNFTVNRYSGIQVSAGRVQVAYALDMAEIPTQQEKKRLDADGNGTITAAEFRTWSGKEARSLLAGVELSADGSPVRLRVTCSTAHFGPGQAGLPVLRLDAGFSGVLASPQGSISYRDQNDPERIGWREITAVGSGGTALQRSSVPASSVSDELHAYPKDLLSSPLDVRQASLTYGPGASDRTSTSPCAASGGESALRPGITGGGFADLVQRADVTPAVLALSLLLAIGFGALHAMGPGHGKTLMAAYLVGAGGRIRHATAVGGAVALMHTASVLGLGLLVLALERTFSPERVYPWLGVASGLVALGLGAALLVGRLGAWANERRGGGAHPHIHETPPGPIASPPEAGGTPGPAAPHSHGPGTHTHPVADAPLSRRGLTALAVAGGILPSPTALVVLLSAVSFHRVVFGLALIAAFSLGLAAALVVVGLVAIGARDAVTSRLSSGLGRLLPVFSAACIVGVGAFLTIRGAMQI